MKFIQFGTKPETMRPRPRRPFSLFQVGAWSAAHRSQYMPGIEGDEVEGDFTRGIGTGIGVSIGLVAIGATLGALSKMKGY